MGWTFSHMFQFSDKRHEYTIIAGLEFEEEAEFSFIRGPKTRKAETVKLEKDFMHDRDAKPFWYWYDFGDSWWHRITFQKPAKKDLNLFQGFPVCIESFGACPPEDVGGPWGYDEFLGIIHDKKHPEYEEYREWAGLTPRQKYDEEFTDMGQINENLEDYFGTVEWNMTADKYFT